MALKAGIRRSNQKIDNAKFVYIMQNYPFMRPRDLVRIFEVSSPTASSRMKSYDKGDYDHITPDASVENEIREYCETYYPNECPSKVEKYHLHGFKNPNPAITMDMPAEPDVIPPSVPEPELTKPTAVTLTLDGASKDDIEDFIELALLRLKSGDTYNFNLTIEKQ